MCLGDDETRGTRNELIERELSLERRVNTRSSRNHHGQLTLCVGLNDGDGDGDGEDEQDHDGARGLPGGWGTRQHRPHTPSVECRVSSVECRVSSVERRVSSVECRGSRVEVEVSNSSSMSRCAQRASTDPTPPALTPDRPLVLFHQLTHSRPDILTPLDQQPSIHPGRVVLCRRERASPIPTEFFNRILET